MSKRSIAVPVDRNPRRAKASAAPPDPDPDTRMADPDTRMADADDADADAKSSPQAASSNEEESKTYQMLVNEIVETFVAHMNLNTVKNDLRVKGETGEEDSEDDLRRGICVALSSAFRTHESDIVEHEGNDEYGTTKDLAKASLKFFKHQPERFIIVNEMDLYGYLAVWCTNVLNEYYKKTKEQDQSQTVSSESKDRMVPVNYFISDTALSHKYDVEKFVLQANKLMMSPTSLQKIVVAR